MERCKNIPKQWEKLAFPNGEKRAGQKESDKKRDIIGEKIMQEWYRQDCIPALEYIWTPVWGKS